jgi:hypothetical protein
LPKKTKTKKTKQIDNIDDNQTNRRDVLTPNILRLTDLGAIGPKLVTWVTIYVSISAT